VRRRRAARRSRRGSTGEARHVGLVSGFVGPAPGRRHSPEVGLHSNEGRSPGQPRPSARRLWTSSGRRAEPMTLNCVPVVEDEEGGGSDCGPVRIDRRNRGRSDLAVALRGARPLRVRHRIGAGSCLSCGDRPPQCVIPDAARLPSRDGSADSPLASGGTKGRSPDAAGVPAYQSSPQTEDSRARGPSVAEHPFTASGASGRSRSSQPVPRRAGR